MKLEDLAQGARENWRIIALFIGLAALTSVIIGIVVGTNLAASDREKMKDQYVAQMDLLNDRISELMAVTVKYALHVDELEKENAKLRGGQTYNFNGSVLNATLTAVVNRTIETQQNVSAVVNATNNCRQVFGRTICGYARIGGGGGGHGGGVS